MPLDHPYATTAPNAQSTLDLFKGEWACRLPSPLDGATAGAALAFDDPRVVWARDRLAEFGRPIPGAQVVELGPLEGAHTYMLSRLGAASVTAIEAHERAFLKCLVVKELLGIERVNFLFGDAVAYLRESQHRFDLCFGAGLLYHMVNPVEVIELMCRRSRAVFLWTMHWDEEFNRTHPQNQVAHTAVFQSEHGGFRHTLHRHDYGGDLNYKTFWGGPAPYAHWMERDDILNAFRHFGFGRLVVETVENPYGRALMMVALPA